MTTETTALILVCMSACIALVSLAYTIFGGVQ